ncbi:hypothetical protein DFH05DRAFT_1460960 [Lentinula detonsa]|uniref:Uncharacterized protein n=1 Tax=Lentinula detonsa TaxID=2804962 RepID=A0A9W8TX78_9AGAR|nr:hypothetical protein DFH05DRAFT_1460960 [Lentinula detonsa]
MHLLRLKFWTACLVLGSISTSVVLATPHPVDDSIVNRTPAPSPSPDSQRLVLRKQPTISKYIQHVDVYFQGETYCRKTQEEIERAKTIIETMFRAAWEQMDLEPVWSRDGRKLKAVRMPSFEYQGFLGDWTYSMILEVMLKGPKSCKGECTLTAMQEKRKPGIYDLTISDSRQSVIHRSRVQVLNKIEEQDSSAQLDDTISTTLAWGTRQECLFESICDRGLPLKMSDGSYGPLLLWGYRLDRALVRRKEAKRIQEFSVGRLKVVLGATREFRELDVNVSNPILPFYLYLFSANVAVATIFAGQRKFPTDLLKNSLTSSSSLMRFPPLFNFWTACLVIGLISVVCAAPRPTWSESFEY